MTAGGFFASQLPSLVRHILPYSEKKLLWSSTGLCSWLPWLSALVAFIQAQHPDLCVYNQSAKKHFSLHGLAAVWLYMCPGAQCSGFHCLQLTYSKRGLYHVLPLPSIFINFNEVCDCQKINAMLDGVH